MTWRGSSSPTDRIFACLTYLLPLLNVIGLVGVVLATSGSFLAPLLALVVIPLSPLLGIYYGFGGFMPLIVFFALYLLVVRNDRVAHFIRFNAMQSILIGILLSLFSIIWSYVLASIFPTTSLVAQTLFNSVFLATLGVSIYCIFQSALGRYAEIPTISEAAYTQVRY
ncbi:Tic20-like protein [Leptolyngbyaceae cyanobacterium JSC-12]|nr:Tic20-like protein [Leptolyngbyaceae cyanobacterium JSC-12]